jgi:hypothetical protein
LSARLAGMKVRERGSSVLPSELDRLARLDLHVLAVGVGDEPAQLAMLRRIVVRHVEPRAEHTDDPLALSVDRRVGRQDRPAALALVGRAADPAHEEADLQLEELHRLVEAEEIVRLALPGLLVAELFAAPNSISRRRPCAASAGRAVEAVARAVEADRLVGERAEVGVLPAHDERAAMLR